MTNGDFDLDKYLSGYTEVKLPETWERDPKGRYVKTSKEDALRFFNEQEWEQKPLALAAIDLRNRKKVFFVTGGWGSNWDKTTSVAVQQVKDSIQMDSEFSGDVPPGRFFVRK